MACEKLNAYFEKFGKSSRKWHYGIVVYNIMYYTFISKQSSFKPQSDIKVWVLTLAWCYILKKLASPNTCSGDWAEIGHPIFLDTFGESISAEEISA